MAAVRIRALTTAPRIKPTSIFLRSARRPNPGRRSTYRRGIVVQTTETGSVYIISLIESWVALRARNSVEVIPAVDQLGEIPHATARFALRRKSCRQTCLL